METQVVPTELTGTLPPSVANRLAHQEMTADAWVETHGSGTLRKNKRIRFAYIPAHALLVGTTTPVHSLTLSDLCYFKACPDMNITVNVHATLAGPFCKRVCWMPRTAAWVNITQYICTIDWFQDNHNAHLVVLETVRLRLFQITRFCS
jgi:hypothetical protein